jgi:hypothetical protein
MREIAEINSQQQASWGAFTPILDVRLAPLNDDNSFCLMGTSLSEQIVTVQGARLFSTGDASLAELARTQALYYGGQGFPGWRHLIASSRRPKSPDGCFIQAPFGCTPARGRKLSALLPRIARAYGLGRWSTDYTFTFVSESIANSPLLGMYGYRHIEPHYRIFSGDKQTYEGSLVWMNRDGLLTDMREALSAGFAKVDGVVGDRGRKDKSVAAG